MTITVKNHKNVYSPPEGVLEQVYVELDFSQESNADDYYKFLTVTENIAIHAIYMVVIETPVSSGSTDFALATSSGGQQLTTPRSLDNLVRGNAQALQPIITAVSTLDLIGEEVTTTVTTQVSTPLVAEQVPLDVGLNISGDAMVSGKIKMKMVISKAF